MAPDTRSGLTNTHSNAPIYSTGVKPKEKIKLNRSQRRKQVHDLKRKLRKK